MSHSVSDSLQRKSFLSPQIIRAVKAAQSPKFDKQKAQEQHLKRKTIYEQKLARYDQYNSILSAKIHKQISYINSNKSSQIQIQKNSSKNYQNRTKKRSQNSQNFQSSQISSSKHIKCRQPSLALIRQKNKTLHQRNAQLKSYLNEINSGVSQLECILQEVEETYNSLHPKMPQQFSGLWFIDDFMLEDELQKSQKFTKDTVNTVDMENDRTASFMNLRYSRKSSPHGKINYVKCESTIRQNQLKNIDLLEKKFKQILQNITKRQMFELQIDSEVSELNALEKEIDQLRQQHSKQMLKNSTSEKNLSGVQNRPQLSQITPSLSKVKSLGRILC